MAARHKRAKGGHMPQLVSGNPEVVDEAEERKTGDEDTVSQSEKRARHKRGGGVKKHGKHHGKEVGHMSGEKAHHRGDRPKRASGGGVGANRSPLSTAHNTTSQAAGSSNPTDTYGGTPK